MQSDFLKSMHLFEGGVEQSKKNDRQIVEFGVVYIECCKFRSHPLSQSYSGSETDREWSCTQAA